MTTSSLPYNFKTAMTDTTAPVPDAADLRGRPGAGALLMEQMGEAGRRRLEMEFSVEREIREIETVYERLLADGRR